MGISIIWLGHASFQIKADGKITPFELHQYVSNKIGEKYGVNQIPVWKGEVVGQEFHLVKKLYERAILNGVPEIEILRKNEEIENNCISTQSNLMFQFPNH